jgi:hypothetical protein
LGAQLELCLSNLNLLLPRLWPQLRDAEKWQVGLAYSEVYNAGLEKQSAGLKQALVKVKGFDFVPENLRSQTFVRAVEAIFRAHEGMNNFYTEESPTSSLEALGTVIPSQALGPCITALLCVRLGNYYGCSWAAKPVATRMLKRLSPERWTYYPEKVLPDEIRIHEKLLDDKPRKEWSSFVRDVLPDGIRVENRDINDLIKGPSESTTKHLVSVTRKLITAYYGRESDSHRYGLRI